MIEEGLYIPRQNMPKHLQEVYVDFHWSTPKLWALAINTAELNINELDWILDYPVWYMSVHSIPREIMNNPNLDLAHSDRIKNADLNFPIHIIQWKERMLVLDGIHRLIKAKLAGKEKLKAKILKHEDISKIYPSKIDLENGFLEKLSSKLI